MVFKKILNVLATVLKVVSIVSASTACWIFLYQPKVPKSLMN